MAEPTRSPSLPSTADAAPYVPVSWAAAAAASVAAAFLAALLLLGYFAFKNNKPLLMGELLVLPALAVVLSFAARRMVRNSEGTRTEYLYGVNLVDGAWWGALTIGLCYIAYLFAIDYAIRREARGEVEKWMGLVTGGTEEGRSAYYRMLQPRARQDLSPEDKPRFELQFRNELLQFRNGDLMQLAQRNRGEFEYAAGPVTWAQKTETIEAMVAGVVKCPEGVFPLVVALKGSEGVTGGGRQWSLALPSGGGFIDQRAVARTPYGWLLLFLEKDGGSFGKGFITHLAAGPVSHVYAYRGFVAPNGDWRGWGGVAADPSGVSQLAFAGPAGVLAVGAGEPADAGYAAYTASQFCKLPGGGEPSAQQKRDFFTTWNAQGVRPAGDKLKDQGGGVIDKEDTLVVTDTAIEVRVPVEIPLMGKSEVARGRVVVTCTDPALLAEVKQLKASADPNRATASPDEELFKRKVTWRVARIESELTPISTAPVNARSGPGGAGGMPGMGG